MSRLYQNRIKTASEPCQNRVRTVSETCQKRVRTVSEPCQNRVRVDDAETMQAREIWKRDSALMPGQRNLALRTTLDGSEITARHQIGARHHIYRALQVTTTSAPPTTLQASALSSCFAHTRPCTYPRYCCQPRYILSFAIR
jgi:hypothetical protein